MKKASLKTEIFATYEAFTRRINRRTNGVSPEFAAKYPNWKSMNKDNLGCWECLNCGDCLSCVRCVDCSDCDACIECTNCWDCGHCGNCDSCTQCRHCENCDDCSICGGCYGGESLNNETDYNNEED